VKLKAFLRAARRSCGQIYPDARSVTFEADRIVAFTAFEGVVARAAIENVAVTVTHQRIFTIGADDVLDAAEGVLGCFRSSG